MTIIIGRPEKTADILLLNISIFNRCVFCFVVVTVGRLVPNVSTEFEWSDVLKTSPSRAGDWPTSPVLAGGQWQPAHCVSNNRLAVIIPCRDRDSHLRVMLRHLIPVLQRQLAHFMIFVVEQVRPIAWSFHFISMYIL